MRPGSTTAILIGAAILVYALLPGGLVALAGFELLILIAAWMAIRRITRTSVPAEDDARPSLWSWIPWSRAPAGKPAPPSPACSIASASKRTATAFSSFSWVLHTAARARSTKLGGLFVCRKSGDQGGGRTPGQLFDCSTCIRSL